MGVKKVRSASSIRRILAVMMALVMVVTCFNGIKAEAASSGFYVSGTTIYDANGNPFEMRGVNIAHAWYTSYTEESIKGAASLGANTVRVVLADGQQYTKTTYSEVSNIINWCKENQVVCVLEVHDATGSDSTSALDNAVNYWIEMKDLLNANTEYVILNIANEWYGTWNGSAWAEGYKSAIQTLRNAGINSMIMVDCAGWGQYPDSIKDYGKSVFNADSQGNTVFSIHMYEYAGGDASTVKTNIDNALGIGVPVVIGEFGGQHSNGDVDEYTIMSYCEEKGVGYLGWSWKGNSSDLSYLDIANSWDGSSLTTWGNTLFYDTNGIKNTATTCSVYTGSSSSSGSSSSGSSSSDSTSSSSDYVSLFYGSASSSNWGQAVSVYTNRAGGSFDASNIKSGGHFYVEYKGTQDKVELVLQSWSGGSSWGKVSISESGTANGNYYAKFSYDNCVSTFGSSDFSGKLDAIHVGAQDANIEVVSLCYDFGSSSSSSSSTTATAAPTAAPTATPAATAAPTATPAATTAPTVAPTTAPSTSSDTIVVEFEDANRYEQNGSNKVDSSMFSGYSGDGYVYLASGWGEVGFTVSESGTYRITLVSNADTYKENWLYLDDSGAGTLYTNGNYWQEYTGEYYLSAGTHKFGVSTSWGYVALDYVTIEKVN